MTNNAKVKDFLDVVTERGFIHQATDESNLKDQLSKGPVTAYIGFDATADSLHVGSLLPIMMLRWLQKTGNQPIVLMGGGTTKIGDPSGKDESRKLLSDEDILDNIEKIKKIFENYLVFGDGATDAVMANNADWLDGLNYIPFLREVGQYFTINRMLGFESVKQRLDREQPLSFLEFNYMILQGYDFVQLKRRYGCIMQMGGSDQWGNIINGIELGRKLDQTSLYGLTTPLLTTSSGAKMGKSAGGAVWLSPHRLSHYDFWQYWRNTEDGDVIRFLKLFTELPMEQITQYQAVEGAELNDIKVILANEVTGLCRGKQAAQEAEKTARKTFAGGGLDENLPTLILAASENSVGILAALTKLGFTASNGEARRAVMQGGIKLQDQVIDDPNHQIILTKTNQPMRISFGKKKHGIIKLDA